MTPDSRPGSDSNPWAILRNDGMYERRITIIQSQKTGGVTSKDCEYESTTKIGK